MVKGQISLKWLSPVYKPKLHIYNTIRTSTKQIKGLKNEHAPKPDKKSS